MPVCKHVDPVFADQGNGHYVACHLYPGSGAEEYEGQGQKVFAVS
jgi:hypothetical protein